MLLRISYCLRRCLVGLPISAVLFLGACTRPQQDRVEAPPVYQPTTQTPQLELPKLKTANLSEVEDAVRRVFKDAVQIHSSHQPKFVTGDFNGDDSEDVAVVLQPAPGKLPSLNEEYPAWLLRDPFAGTDRPATNLRVEEHDVLLAVIHGFGPDDWRDPQATQTFLLKNSAGSGMTIESAKSVGDSYATHRMPRFHGDLIAEVVRGNSGYLYFNKSTYAWYDPKTYKGESDKGVIHAGSMRN